MIARGLAFLGGICPIFEGVCPKKAMNDKNGIKSGVLAVTK